MIPSLSDQERSIQLLLQLLGNVNVAPNFANATMNWGDNARLSQQFQPIDRPVLTPIPNHVIQPAPLYTTANTGGGYSMSSANAGAWRRPPLNYGHNRDNSLPPNFGLNLPQLSNGGTHSSVQFRYAGNDPSNIAPSAGEGPRVGGDTYGIPGVGSDQGLPNANVGRPVDNGHAYDNKLDFILATLASLTEEVSTIRQARNSVLTESAIQNPQGGQTINPSATYTIDPNASANTAMNTQSNSIRSNHQSVQIHKWNWKFSADKTSSIPEQRDLTAFLKKLELYREAENLTYEQIHKKFHFLIGGYVYEWYMQYRHRFANWEQLVGGLKKQFTTPLTQFMKVAKLAARRQGRDETAMAYIASIQREFDEMGMYSEKEKLSIIQNGFNERLRNVALSHDWDSVQAMDLHLRTIEVADELRKETESQAQKRPFFPRRSVNALEMKETSVVGGMSENDQNNSDDNENVTGEVDC